jgi:hypothetical protein
MLSASLQNEKRFSVSHDNVLVWRREATEAANGMKSGQLGTIREEDG